MKLTLPDRRFGGYIFDCDGTLADTMPLHYQAWKRLVEENGGTFSEELFYSLGGRPTEQIMALLRDQHGLHVADVHAAALRKEEYFVDLIRAVKPIEPVLRIARQMHGVAPLAVASGGLRKYVELTLDVLGIRGLFASVVCVEDYARAKPAPDPFLEAARRLNVAPAECVVFEDSPLGVQAAEAAGMECVFVPRNSEQ
jgi:beta-phosphoglucomutase family hydrolase